MRQTYDPDAMFRLFALRDRLGLTWAELSERCGIPISTLLSRRRRLEQAGSRSGDGRPAFVELSVDRPSMQQPGSFSFEITVGAVSIRVAPGFDPTDLERLLEILELRC